MTDRLSCINRKLVVNRCYTYLDLEDTTDGDLEARPLEEWDLPLLPECIKPDELARNRISSPMSTC